MVGLDDSPSGIVTFAFTDIEGSSRMTRALEEREGRGIYERRLRDPQRDRLLGEARKHGGREVQRAGDGHMLVFPHAEDALTAVVAFQRSLDDDPISYRSGDELFAVRVRIGVHTSEKERRPEIDRDGLLEYPGGDTNFAARIGTLGVGGQIIISEETHSRYAGPREGLTFYPWENRLLKSFDDAPQTVYEVLYRPGQQPREPGGRFFPAFYVGERNRYIERLDKEEEVFAQFRNRRRDGTTSRLVTIWAEGGMGKTRLGVACAVKLAGLFEGRVHLADLAAREPKREAVAEAIARALELPTEASQPDRLLDALRIRKASLILLDNAEAVHDEDVARFLAKLATETPGIYLLVMSRTKVGVSDVERLVSLNEGMTEPEARALFLATARREGCLLGDLSPDDEAQICRIITLTERIPLAIELAAAWTDEATLKEIADGLKATPLGDYATLPPDAVRSDDEATRRHIAMVRSLDWSYDLLGRTPEVRSTRRTFAACGLFADTFTAEAVAALTEHRTARTDLARLHRASLVRRDEAAGVSRYFLHRFTRDYAARKLGEFPDADDIRQRFVAYHVAFVEQNTGTLNDLDQLALLDREWRNVAAASTLAEALGDHDAVMLLSAIGEFLEFRGLWSESERLKLRAVEAARTTEDRRALGVHLNNLGKVYDRQGRRAEAEDAFTKALQIRREFKDRVGEGQTLNNLGIVYQSQGRRAKAEDAFTKALQIRREFQDRVGEGQTLNNLGVVYQSQGRWAEAEKAHDQALQIKREFKDRVGEGQTLGNLGVDYQSQGRWAKAEDAFTKALQIRREFKDRVGEGHTLIGLGDVYQSQGRWAEAEKAFTKALQIRREFKDRVGEGHTLIGLGNVYQSQGRWAEAEKAYDQDLQICREFKDRVGEGQTLNNLGLLWDAREDRAKAQQWTRQAVDVLEGTEAASELAKARETLARLEGGAPSWGERAADLASRTRRRLRRPRPRRPRRRPRGGG